MSWTNRSEYFAVSAIAAFGGDNKHGGLPDTSMRRRIIEALTYPRILLLANMDADQCPQNLYYNSAHRSCRYCRQGEECLWLNRNDEFSVLAAKPLEQLYESLIFCIDYVDAQCSCADHNVRRCACESCQWVRKARQLAWEFSNSVPA